jgi:hypothetical protein
MREIIVRFDQSGEQRNKDVATFFFFDQSDLEARDLCFL